SATRFPYTTLFRSRLGGHAEGSGGNAEPSGRNVGPPRRCAEPSEGRAEATRGTGEARGASAEPSGGTKPSRESAATGGSIHATGRRRSLRSSTAGTAGGRGGVARSRHRPALVHQERARAAASRGSDQDRHRPGGF